MKKRGRTTSDTGTSFFGKQFSISSSGSQSDVITQPPKTSSTTSEISKIASNLMKASTSTSSTASAAAASESGIQKTETQPIKKSSITSDFNSSNTSSPSNVLDTFEQENKYKPVTNFNPQERINPFDKESKTSSPSSGIYSKNASTIESITTKREVTETKIDNTKFSSAISAKSIDSSKNTYDTDKSYTKYGISSSTASYTKPSSSSFSASQSSIESNYSSTKVGTEPVLDNKPSSSIYSRSESGIGGYSDNKIIRGTLERKISDADIIFGDKTPYTQGTERLSRGGGSLSDADVAFSGIDRYASSTPSSTTKYRSESSMLSKSMSVSSDKSDASDYGNSSKPSYRIYEGIQNAAFQDFDSPTKSTSSLPSATATTTTTTKTRWNRSTEDNDFDLK